MPPADSKYWQEIDSVLESQSRYVRSDADFKSTCEQEQAAFAQNLPRLRQVIEDWQRALEERGFSITPKCEPDGAFFEFRKRGYYGRGGVASWHHPLGGLIAGQLDPRGSGSAVVYSNEPSLNVFLGTRFDPEQLHAMLRDELKRFVDPGNLIVSPRQYAELTGSRLRADKLADLKREFERLDRLDDRQRAGREFESLVGELLALEALAPSGSFRVPGEQMDNSFVLDGVTYLVEAKWEIEPLPQAELLVFKGKIEGKSPFTRGVFIAVNGISEAAAEAMRSGKTTPFFVLERAHLEAVLANQVGLIEQLRDARRSLDQTGSIIAPLPATA
ncbi:MAG: hypothetical protein HY763_11615 [Planctomycetes bacterium]|nr:hypothetical protein [Planctomycetota bacterium]